ncbi:hypothetical protein SAMN04488023_104125 [Pedobacter rhizosphaerae]|uniref:Uncharacterized protein n=1 Tax=Pedobacter rhizosphaerae TaxID=390241 RepID=A0A1H9LF52_9SPHI|nr:hypothetical protein SAMN04488023_104125 [Pedobacter rhizosphaerae]
MPNIWQKSAFFMVYPNGLLLKYFFDSVIDQGYSIRPPIGISYIYKVVKV